MKKAIAFDPDFKNRGKGRRRGKVSVDTDAQNLTGSLTFYATPEIPDGGYVIISDGNTAKGIAAGSAKPVFWTATDDTVVDIVNGLPNNSDKVYTIPEALNYLNDNDYFVLTSDEEEIVADSLILELDASKKSSFIDNKPTVNFFDDGHFPLGLDMAKENGSNPTNQVIRFPNNPGNSNYVLEQTMGSAYTEYQINLTTELQPSTTYCLSGWYAESADYDGSQRMFHCRAFSAGGSHIALGSGLYNVVETKTIDGITWRYCYATITTPSDYSNSFNWYVGYSNDSYNGARYYTNLQMEEGTYPTPYSAGTRNQNTDWYDLSGENLSGSILNGVTFNSGGWFDFDGTNDKIITNDITGPQSYTFDFVAKNKGGTGYLIYKNNSMNYVDNSDNGDVYLSGTDVRFHTEYDTTGDDKTTPSISGAVTLNKFAHIVATYDYSSKVQKIYVDGELKSSIDNSSQPGNLFRGNKFYSIGVQGYSNHGGQAIDRNFLSGSISSVKIYDKALSLSEVQQNYYKGNITTNNLVLAVDAGNLVSYESGSTTTYSMTGSINGSLENGTSYLNLNGGTWDFDGTNDQINFGDESSLDFTNGVFSMETWIYIPSSWTGGSQYPNLISKGAKAGWDTDGWSLFCFRNYGSGTGYTVGVGLRNSGTTNVRVSYNQPTETWLHVVGTLDGSSIKVYVNGELKTSNTQTINPASNNYNVLLGRDTHGNSFPGKIAISRLYNKTLTASEVGQNFEAQRARFGL